MLRKKSLCAARYLMVAPLTMACGAGTADDAVDAEHAALAIPVGNPIPINCPPLRKCFYVTNTADSGAGSLRQALTDANNWQPGIGQLGYKRSVLFDIPGAGPHTITPSTVLPYLSKGVFVDGYSQTGAVRSDGTTPPTLQVILDGSAMQTDHSGLYINSVGNRVSGLAIHSFPGDGITIWREGNTIDGNFIGVDESGLVARPNGGNGVAIDCPVGGVVSDNVIGGNEGSGILLDGADGNVITNNSIGTSHDGQARLGNDYHGVEIQNADDNVIGGLESGTGNLIQFNGGDGVSIFGIGLRNSVQRNDISRNGELGIDLGNDGPTPNDTEDADQGINGLLNTPVLVSALRDAGDEVEVTYAMEGPVGELNRYRVELFVNKACGPARAEGRTYKNRCNVNVQPGDGRGESHCTLQNVPPDAYITATATVWNDGQGFEPREDEGSTSEFSDCLYVP